MKNIALILQKKINYISIFTAKNYDTKVEA